MLKLARRANQLIFLGLFAFLIWEASTTSPPRAPVGIFHQADPLNAVGIVVASGWLPKAFLVFLAVAIPTIFLGRVFCGWVCPSGTLQELAWLALGKSSGRRLRYSRWQQLKYWLLIFMLAAGIAGSLHTTFLDPISLLSRGLYNMLGPALPSGTPTPGAWTLVFLLLGVLAASTFWPRFFCRVMCPLGALLGLLARLAPFRIRRVEERCTACGLCIPACQGGAEPMGRFRVSECMVCLSCMESCPQEGAITYGAALSSAPDPETIPARRALLALGLGLVVGPVLRATGGGRGKNSRLIRPPGALPESSFLTLCAKCMLCQAACPTGVIQPAVTQAGVEGVWTPVLVPRRGWCEFQCNSCGQVCPTGAIRPLSLQEKQRTKIGTAFVDRSLCLPWALGKPCIVCEEVCPTDPKAITLQPTKEGVKAPVVDPSRCIGCGICENRCPVGEKAAIRVYAQGESREPSARILLVELRRDAEGQRSVRKA